MISLWYNNVKNIPWEFKWFILFILIRPIISIFYDLKEISPLLSPLYIVAGITPILILLSVTLGKKLVTTTNISSFDIIMFFWGSMVFINGVIVFNYDEMILSVDVFLRMMLPFILYYYLRFYVRSMHTLLFILKTMLFASIIPAVFLVYEVMVSPLEYRMIRGGLIRHSALYADWLEYSIYSIYAFIIITYLYLGPMRSKVGKYVNSTMLIFVILLIILALLSIVHIATTVIFLCLAGMFIYNLSRRSFIIFVSVFIVLVVFIGILFSEQINDKIIPLFQSEISVIKGDRDIKFLGHGRMGRIISYQEIWSSQSTEAKLFGMAFSNVPDKLDWMGGTIHNEYLRSLYISGYVGLFLFLLLLILSFIQSFKFLIPEKYLFQGFVVIVALYSISSLPMLYYSLIYVFLPVIAYLSHSSSFTKKQIKSYIHAL